MTTQLETLQRLRDRWIAEYPAVLAADPSRAHHHLQAIEDLELLIGRLQRTAPTDGPNEC